MARYIDAYELLGRITRNCDQCSMDNHDPLRVLCGSCRRDDDVEIIEEMIKTESVEIPEKDGDAK